MLFFSENFLLKTDHGAPCPYTLPTHCPYKVEAMHGQCMKKGRALYLCMIDFNMQYWDNRGDNCSLFFFSS